MSAIERFYFRINNLGKAHGEDSEFAFKGVSATAFAEDLQAGLRDPDLFERWRSKQDDPDSVPKSLAPFDPDATVHAHAADTHTDIEVVTKLPHLVVAHRITLLIGRNWTLRDVGPA
ncbi:MAG TPA: hypothetical protein VFN09_14570 [Rhodanobacteraceae bacterium]|nr:hypothetical protein [Rhodanobacteraceae bacterium]